MKDNTRLFLGLIPVVAAASTGVSGLTLGVVLFAVLLCGSLVMAAIGRLFSDKARVAAAILVICLFTGIAQMLVQMLFPVIAAELGVFLPLCAVGAMLVMLPEPCLCRGLKSGAVSLILLTLVGILREIIGSGRLFGATLWSCENARVLIARFPAGAFILLGILLAIVAAIRNHGKEDEQ